MSVVVAGVYRRRNVAILQQLLTGIPDEWLTAWWSLDEIEPSLAADTVGVGRGGKFDLLNVVLERAAPDLADVETVVLVDDDVWLDRGNLSELVALTRRAGFGLAQPAHGRGSQSTYAFNRRHALATARETTFVEIGPIVVIDGRWCTELLPFPAEFGMGWGLELLWRRRRRDGLRMGIVDAVTVQHPDPPNATYLHGADAEFARVDKLLAEDSVNNIREVQKTVGVWRRWRRQPPKAWLR